MAFLLLSLLASLVSGQRPRRVSWSSDPIGPDGPWNALDATLGENSIALFPGARYSTWTTTAASCLAAAYKHNGDESTTFCPAGYYNYDSDNDEVEARAASGMCRGIDLSTDKIDVVEETLTVDLMDGGGQTQLENQTVAILDEQEIVYPGGKNYPFFAGCMNLGTPERLRRFKDNYTPTPAWAFVNESITGSASFGLHLGSASRVKMDGSLVFGGYDQHRLVGDVLERKGAYSDPILLQDMSIETIKGKSPLASGEGDGLLRAGNETIPSRGLDVILDPCSPYLTLPKSTCDAIASHLPVDYNEDLGLYIWDTQNSSYDAVIRDSATVLAFDFMGESNTQTVRIRVPFAHLDLTLERPLVRESTQYMPCFTYDTGHFVLGRAFFQDAFLAADWGQKKWWLAQAPGPDMQSSPSVVEINGEEDQTVETSGNDWEQSWASLWDDIPEFDGGAVFQGTPDKGLSTGAKVGIGVGCGVGVLLLVATLFFLWRRRRAAAPAEKGDAVTTTTAKPSSRPMAELPPDYSPHNYELASSSEPTEIDGRSRLAELHG